MKIFNKVVAGVAVALGVVFAASAFAQNTNTQQTTLNYDATNSRIGINTATPSTALDVSGTINAVALTISGTGINSKAGYVTFSGTPAAGSITVSASLNLSGTTINKDGTGAYRLNVVSGFCATDALNITANAISGSQAIVAGVVSSTLTSGTIQTRLTSNSTVGDASDVHVRFACK
jgi:type IV secretory pathway VirJ component